MEPQQHKILTNESDIDRDPVFLDERIEAFLNSVKVLNILIHILNLKCPSHCFVLLGPVESNA